MKVIKIEGHEGVVESGELRRKANFMMLKDVKVGEYVLLHAGFAITKVKTREAEETIRTLRKL